MRFNAGKVVWAMALGWMLTLVVLLGQNSPVEAQRQGPRPPFANAVQQRAEMLTLLKQIRDLLQEQNALLKSGKVRVVVQAEDRAR